jgi:hypothetical protein
MPGRPVRSIQYNLQRDRRAAGPLGNSGVFRLDLRPCQESLPFSTFPVITLMLLCQESLPFSTFPVITLMLLLDPCWLFPFSSCAFENWSYTRESSVLFSGWYTINIVIQQLDRTEGAKSKVGEVGGLGHLQQGDPNRRVRCPASARYLGLRAAPSAVRYRSRPKYLAFGL